ncbi:hypothetical protein V7x_52080 [Crateriforma conspicua]|uniref:Uncharacterized protein n=1 Tax=Crateriforma conspicua TaxID=2527996 RepID=A0A5C6FSB8_9PLAN|nr:hypothetical protein V7x_52080 [Crateriforma conspicua]
MSLLRFSISRLLAITALIAATIAVWPYYGHLIVFACVLSLLVMTAYYCIRPCSLFARVGRVAILVFITFLTFSLSIGPASWYLARRNNADQRDAAACELYRYWFTNTAFRVHSMPDAARNAAMWYIGNGLRPGAKMYVNATGFGWHDRSATDTTRGLSFHVISY